jgi:folylpolyglutamate synthase
VDSILSQYFKSHDIPSKYGLFTSPQLIAVRERIRVNSSPISKSQFAKYFFEVWDALKDVDKPVYFRYLTLMSYHVFIREGVDAAVYEVGVGGEYDSTNIIEAPAVTGISSLGIDHTYSLGETIEEIAWHKAGIQKRDCPSFTVTQQAAAMNVVQKRAKERNVKGLKVVGQDERLEGVAISPDAPFQKLNASLAIALAETVLKRLDATFHPSSDRLSQEFKEGLEKVNWRGRCEKKTEGNITWYLDGAHTADSIVVASKWFGTECSQKCVFSSDTAVSWLTRS